MAKICFFCGGAPAHHPAVEHAAASLAEWCAENGHEVILGGMASGVMRTIGTAALSAGGKVTIVYPQKLRHQAGDQHENLTHQQVLNLHARLEKMTELADCFIAFPGGIGTLHEIVQVWADNQIGNHAKPVFVYNLQNYFDPLAAFTENAVEIGYINARNATYLHFFPTGEAIHDALSAYLPHP